MTRLFYASGDISLARRTLLLYIQVVGKAWQANGEILSDDTDVNDRWVETLVSGARMLCKTATSLPGTEGIDEARDAWTCIEKARTRLDQDNKELVASLDLAEGVWNSVMALKGAHVLFKKTSFRPLTRPRITIHRARPSHTPKAPSRCSRSLPSFHLSASDPISVFSHRLIIYTPWPYVRSGASH